jgi:hypothetical protein
MAQVEEMVLTIVCSKLTSRYVTLSVSLAILVANFGTSIITPAVPIIAEEFGVGFEVGVLSISLFLIGFGMQRTMRSDGSGGTSICGTIVRRIWPKCPI